MKTVYCPVLLCCCLAACTDPCDEVDCGEFGECNEGSCRCDEFHEGELCEYPLGCTGVIRFEDEDLADLIRFENNLVGDLSYEAVETISKLGDSYGSFGSVDSLEGV